MQYKLSIITINRNNSFGLNKTCLSVTTQTFEGFEWIIIDGSSEDDSVDIIKRYSDNVNYWVSEPDSGVYNAMNKGIKRATGEYLLFLNSGDYLLHPWTLQDVINEIGTSPYADVYFSDAVLSTFEVSRYPETVTLKFFIKGMLNHQNCIIRRDLFNNQLYDEKYQILADRHFFIKKIMEGSISFLHIKTNISIYENNGISSMSNLKKILPEWKCILNEFNLKERNKFITSFIKIAKKIKYILPYGLYKLIKCFLVQNNKKLKM